MSDFTFTYPLRCQAILGRLFLSKLSWRYFTGARAYSKEPNEEMMVGYESGWPASYKKTH